MNPPPAYLVLWRFVLRQGVVHVETEELDLLEMEAPIHKDPEMVKESVMIRITEAKSGERDAPDGRTCVPRSSGSGQRFLAQLGRAPSWGQWPRQSHWRFRPRCRSRSLSLGSLSNGKGVRSRGPLEVD